MHTDIYSMHTHIPPGTHLHFHTRATIHMHTYKTHKHLHTDTHIHINTHITLGVGDGQGGLACCNSWGCKESDTTDRLN